jgi:exonuclease, DNA polymerase III, epsilon subunit family
LYAILDIETTGGKLNEESITEIAIYRFDGISVTDRFISLINPERKIDTFVQKLTGISDKMVRNAPKFYEVAKRIVEITENCVLVAHNASFDYRMLRLEFRRLGFDFQRNTICTVEMSQRLLPSQESYSLGKLTRSLGIPLTDRHRANGDALATLHLFKLLITKDTEKTALTKYVKQNINNSISFHLLSILDTLPNELGIYYIYNKEGNIIFLSKGKNIYKSVNEHFTSSRRRDIHIQKNVSKVMYELTGTELIASLKEKQELSVNTPLLNKTKKEKEFPYTLIAKTTSKGYTALSIELATPSQEILAIFRTKEEGLNFLFKITEEYTLCTKINGFSQAKTYCFNHSIGKCNGACMSDEAPEEYNIRVEKALEQYTLGERTFVILDKGRSLEEKSIIFIERGCIKGYGFVQLNHQLENRFLHNIIQPIEHTLNNRYLVEYSLRKHSLATQIAIKD